MSDGELVVRARNWDALCLYGWHPYMYNPQLKRWLRRIRVPTLVLWGASDGVVTPAYGRAYAGLIPGARFELIPEAGHHPEIEQAETFADAVVRFLGH
jgi:pimeloyl-ACP methyl ester carboxylesterase